jgi:DNA-binding beta-propeller fold protein YncE
VVAERFQRLDFRDPHTMRLQHQLHVRCSGIDHIDYTRDGRFLLASCEFSGKLAVVNVATEHLVGTIALPGVSGTHMRPMSAGAMATSTKANAATTGVLVHASDGGGGPDGSGMPQDVKLSPDGRTFYVADMQSNGIWLIDAATWRVRGFLHTGTGAHGIYVSRDSKVLYVSNRGEGSIAIVGANSGKLLRTWRIPGGGSPDMGGVSADGKVLWLSGRYNREVYAISTRSGRLIARIPVGSGPHGLSVFPQPGRYSIGHTGVFR